MSGEQRLDRYKHENETVIIEVGVKNSRQLFNERDPAPFRERDLDQQFVTYIVSAVEEFSLRTKMKIRILTADENDLKPENSLIIREAIRTYFEYESKLTKADLRKRHRTARYFFLIGTITLVACLSVAEFASTFKSLPAVANIVSVGFVITGWVAMWRPIEVLLYDWWPVREKRLYFDKIATTEVEVVSTPQ